jgi:hypothetical protein
MSGEARVNERRALIVNKTNAAILAEAFGEETSAWTKKVITLASEMVPFKGRLVNGIRVKPVV